MTTMTVEQAKEVLDHLSCLVKVSGRIGVPSLTWDHWQVIIAALEAATKPAESYDLLPECNPTLTQCPRCNNPNGPKLGPCKLFDAPAEPSPESAGVLTAEMARELAGDLSFVLDSEESNEELSRAIDNICTGLHKVFDLNGIPPEHAALVDTRRAVAWLHRDIPTARAITDRVKSVAINAGEKQAEIYSIPLYALSAGGGESG